LGKLSNKVSIEGHTDAKPFAKVGNYGNWELAADRANAARRLMQDNGMVPGQVVQIRAGTRISNFARRIIRKIRRTGELR